MKEPRHKDLFFRTIDPPKWENINIASVDDIVTLVKQGRFNPNTLETLSHLLLNRQSPKTIYNYHCHNCGNITQPERASEEISICTICQSPNLSYSVRIFSNQKNQHKQLAQKLENNVVYLNNMLFHYSSGKTRQVTLDCGFTPGGCYCQFSCGDKIENKNPRIAILQASILCPFLWDFEFDWTSFYEHKCEITPAMLLAVIAGVKL